jgi:hypothetical protein
MKMENRVLKLIVKSFYDYQKMRIRLGGGLGIKKVGNSKKKTQRTILIFLPRRKMKITLFYRKSMIMLLLMSNFYSAE